MSTYYLSKFFSETELQAGPSFWCGEGLDRLLDQDPDHAAWQALLQLTTRLEQDQCKAALEAATVRIQKWPTEVRKLSSHWGPLLQGDGLSPALLLAGTMEFHRHEQGASLLLSRLATSPSVAQLESLSFNRCELSAATFQKFAESPHFARLQHLHLHNTELEGPALLSLLKAPFFPQLHRLQLSRMDLGPEFHAAILTAPKLPQLQFLNMNDNRLDQASALGLIDSKILSAGATFSLKNNSIQPSEHSKLTAAASQLQINLEL